jgi:hypothetical protein
VLYTGSANTIGGLSWTPGSSRLDSTLSASGGTKFQISGLALGLHTIRLDFVNNGNPRVMGAWIITPIHSPRQNGPYVLQGATDMGSQGIRDLRKFSKKDITPEGVTSRSVAVQNALSVSSTFPGDPIGPSTQITLETAKRVTLKVNGQYLGGAHGGAQISLLINGKIIDNLAPANRSGAETALNQEFTIKLGAGTHNIQAFVRIFSGNVTFASGRTFVEVVEID